MKTITIAAAFFGFWLMIGCGNNNNGADNATSPEVHDTSTLNPTTNAMDYHNDQSQTIPRSDSSNVSGTDTVPGSVSTPNTGTMKSYNDKKGMKDSTY